MFIDTHAHLSAPEYQKDLNEVIQRSRSAGVTRIISIGSGYGIEKNFDAVQQSQLYKCIYATVGIHPHEAKTRDDKSVAILANLAKQGKVVAIGEIGMDFYKEYSPRKIQVEVFREQLKLASELLLPVVIHDRDAHDDILEILRAESIPGLAGVFHCFSGTSEFAQKCVELGFYISIPGVITFKNSKKLVQVVETIPLEWLLLETDCPFLAPEPYRGRRNEPSYIPEIARKIAEVKGVDIETVGKITSSNADKIFRLKQFG